MRIASLLLFALSLLLAFHVAPTDAQTSFWKPVGNPYGGSVYLLTSDGEGRLYTYAGGRIYRSTDRGTTWLPPAPETSVFGFQAMVAGPEGVVVVIFANQIHRSTDAGEHWTQLPSIPGFDESMQYHYIALDKSNGDIYISGTAGIFRSTDDGDTWNQLPEAPAYQVGQIFAARGTVYLRSSRYDMEKNFAKEEITVPGDLPISDMTVTAEGVLFISRYDMNSGYTTYYRSTDKGVTWTTLPDGPYREKQQRLKPGNLDDIYLIGSITFRSTDNGDTWKPLEPIEGRPELHEVSFATTRDGGIYRGGRNALYRSLDTGTTWSAMDRHGIAALNFTQIVYSSKGVVLAVADSQIYRSTDQGTTWNKEETPVGPHKIAATQDGTILLIGVPEPDGISGVFRSDDGGSTWTRVSAFGAPVVHSIVGGPGRDVYMLHQHGRFSSSTDAGATWNINDAIVEATDLLAVDSAGTVYIGRNYLYRSTDRGASWERTDDFPLSSLPTSFTGLTADGAGRLIVNDPALMMVSTDRGDTWREVIGDDAPPFDRMGIRSIVVGPRNRMYLMTSVEVWRSIDGGVTWHNLNSEILYPAPKALTILPGGRAILATEEGGLYLGEDEITGTGEAPKPQGDELALTVAPNPASNRIAIRVNIEERSPVDLRITDLLGREVGIVATGEREAGFGMFEYDISSLPGGVYFIRALVGDAVAVGTIVK